jgi:hypothetical protein
MTREKWGKHTTAVVTMNLLRFVTSLMDLALAPTEERPAARHKAKTMLPAIIGFVVGCGCGCGSFLENRIGFAALALPLILASAAFWVGLDYTRRLRAALA